LPFRALFKKNYPLFEEVSLKFIFTVISGFSLMTTKVLFETQKQKMSNLFQKLGLVKADSDDSIHEQAPIVKPTVQPTTTIVTMGGTKIPQSNTDYNKYLEEVLDKGNKPGVDFLEFHKALNGFDGKPLSEEQKYDFAFIPIQAMGITAQTLESSGRDYLDLLEKEDQSFEAELADAIKTKVEDKKSEVDKLTAENTELTEKIEANNKKIQQLNEQIENSSNSISVEKQAFEYALSNKQAIINDRIAKIQTYLNGTTK
jgi:dynactin complex subunit